MQHVNIEALPRSIAPKRLDRLSEDATPTSTMCHRQTAMTVNSTWRAVLKLFAGPRVKAVVHVKKVRRGESEEGKRQKGTCAASLPLPLSTPRRICRLSTMTTRYRVECKLIVLRPQILVDILFTDPFRCPQGRDSPGRSSRFANSAGVDPSPRSTGKQSALALRK